jgi:hypothetical protein
MSSQNTNIDTYFHMQSFVSRLVFCIQDIRTPFFTDLRPGLRAIEVIAAAILDSTKAEFFFEFAVMW